MKQDSDKQDSDSARRTVARAMNEAGIAQAVNERDGTLTRNSRVVLDRRYLRKDDEGRVIEQPDAMFRRVANNLSGAELNYGATEEERQEVEDSFYRAMTRLEFLPNSPTLMNAGRELQQLSACFVLPVDDSLESIFESAKQTALIHKSGGGTGFSFSRLRPEGDLVGTTGGVASGPVSFIRVFDSATDVVKQGGTRRGANMAILDVTHPDILRFINEKRNPDRLTNFNVSVAVDREFMEQVKDGGEYDLVNPRTKRVTGRLNAREVFDQIIDCAWETGDPGLVFMDRINDTNPNPHLGRIESTNPCFPAGVRIATNRGLITFGELHASQAPIRVLTDNRAREIRQEMADGGTAVATRTWADTGVTLREAVPVFKTRTEWPVFRLETQHGYVVMATEDHEFFTPKGLKRMHQLNPGDEVMLQSGQGVWSEDRSLPVFIAKNKLRARMERGEAKPPTEWSKDLGELLGWITGDGWITHDLPSGRNVPTTKVGLMFGNPQKMQLAPKFRNLIREWMGTEGCTSHRNGTMTLYHSTAMWNFLESLGMSDSDSPEKEVPEAIWSAPRDAALGYISALFSADGTVNISAHGGSCSIRLASSSQKLLQQLQLLLLNEGIVAKIYLRRNAGEKEMPDSNREMKVYQHKAQHELVIDGPSRNRFVENIGFLIPEKQEKAAAWQEAPGRQRTSESFTDRVKSVTPHSTEDVYCTTEPVTNSIVANGLVATQCGEQQLLPYESCNLGSINLARMLRYTEDSVEIDWDRLRETCGLAVRMLDNVIDVNEFPIPEIAEMSRSTRRIGVGVMGWADILIQMGIRYDSEEAIDLARGLMEFIQRETHAASAELAAHRGVYPAWEGSRYDPPGGSGREPVPMRNSAPVTIAPTGTISIIAGASSGIEPLFALSYERNVMDGTRLIEVNPHLEAVARHAGFHSEELMEQVARTGTLQGTDAPGWAREIFRSSRDIAPRDHVSMQAAFQAYTDNSVSKTINLPADATREDVRDAYLQAHLAGCNGITVYRDGSKPDQVLSTRSGREGGYPQLSDLWEKFKAEHGLGGTDDPVTQFLAGTAPEAGGENPLDGPHPHPHPTPRPRPREMSGSTVLVRTGHGNMYVTINDDRDGYPFELFTQVGKAGGCDSAMLEAISRLISMGLRAGLEPSEIIGQLRGITCCPAWDEGVLVRSIPDGVAHALSRNIGEDQAMTGERERMNNGSMRCPDCNAPAVFAEGCESCSDPACGWNRCN